MSPETSTGTQSETLKSVVGIISELALKSDGGKYIYRGEPMPYPKVSSSLYRKYEDIDAEGFDIEIVQNEILLQARTYARYTGEIDDLEILSQLQHNGGETNLIDFTTDFLTALFFACDGEPDESGRVILLSETGEDYILDEPKTPIHRVIAQKSIFVRPDKGFVEPNDTVIVPNSLKPAVLGYLRDRHGISSETIYNDIHGFIRHQNIYQSAYVEFYRGVSSADKGNHPQAIEYYSNAILLNPQTVPVYINRGVSYEITKNYESAIQDYQAVLKLDPEHPGAYNNLGVVCFYQGDYKQAIQYYIQAIELGSIITFCNRGEAWLHLAEWEKAREDLTRAKNEGVDIVGSFRNYYKDVADFEQRNGLKLPDDISEMLGG